MRMIKVKNIGIALLFISVLTASQNVLARQPDEIKTIEQMNARLDFLYGSHDVYYSFFDQLKRDIAQENKDLVAAVVKYPLEVDLEGKRAAIKNKQQFIQNYDIIITPKVKKAVATEQFVGMFSNYRGMMFGNGEIWFSGICLDKMCKNVTVRITGINS